ncbi:hypothetical protein BOTNAR_0410g00120 [Botryotinia narcissicola]|uniref:Trichodiene synthase n=1 Tax=Botryotinia narcissicola TaxID=278944 RepID=A0A4Z1HLL1_9HELO|nr:hypothetical protein BOTNAR_0410g00120 [Botryotinia narcissicola]
MTATFSLNEASLDRGTVTKAQFEIIVRKLLQKISYKPLVMLQDVELESFILEHLLVLARDQHLDLQKNSQIAKVTVKTVHLIYPWHEKALQKLITIYTVIDDCIQDLLPNLRAFRRNLLAGVSSGHFLNGLTKVLAQIVAYYGPFASDFIYVSTFELIAMVVFEWEIGEKLHCNPHAPNFPAYLRSKAGIGEAYAKFLFPEKYFPEATFLQRYIQATPDLLEINGFLNDVFSFYKESVVSTDRNKYVHNYAAVHSITAHEALEAIAANLAECVGRLRLLLSSELEIMKVINAFIEGYIAMNWLPRYRLHECDLPKVLAQDQNSQS